MVLPSSIARNFGNQENLQVSLQLAKPMERLHEEEQLVKGIIAGINAALKIQGKLELILKRRMVILGSGSMIWSQKERSNRIVCQAGRIPSDFASSIMPIRA